MSRPCPECGGNGPEPISHIVNPDDPDDPANLYVLSACGVCGAWTGGHPGRNDDDPTDG